MLKDLVEKKLERYTELELLIASPEIINDRVLYQRYTKEFADLGILKEKYAQYRAALIQMDEVNELLCAAKDDVSLHEMAQAERDVLTTRIHTLSLELEEFLVPRDPQDEKSVIMEIRAGTGGAEATLFANDLFRMYSRYAANHGFKTEILSASESELGGYKEIIFSIEGYNAYKFFKYESGVHRVQRVPQTEASGRIHTSAATVAVLPEAEEIDIHIDPKDLKIDVYRASGAGGQHVNKTDSAVRITHLPTGLVIACQDERSQLKNRSKAMKILRAKLFETETTKQQEKIDQSRKSQVGSGDRSEKIRTYNFPDGRVTDHRIGLTLYQIESIMNGEIEEIIAALIQEDRKKKLVGSATQGETR